MRGRGDHPVNHHRRPALQVPREHPSAGAASADDQRRAAGLRGVKRHGAVPGSRAHSCLQQRRRLIHLRASGRDRGAAGRPCTQRPPWSTLRGQALRIAGRGLTGEEAGIPQAAGPRWPWRQPRIHHGTHLSRSGGERVAGSRRDVLRTGRMAPLPKITPPEDQARPAPCEGEDQPDGS